MSEAQWICLPDFFPLFGSIWRSQWEQFKFNHVAVKLSIKAINLILLFFVAGPTSSADREHCNAAHQIVYGNDPVAMQWWVPTQTQNTRPTMQTQARFSVFMMIYHPHSTQLLCIQFSMTLLGGHVKISQEISSAIASVFSQELKIDWLFGNLYPDVWKSYF